MEYFNETIVILGACGSSVVCIVSLSLSLCNSGRHAPTARNASNSNGNAKSETCECGLCQKRKGLLCFEYKFWHKHNSDGNAITSHAILCCGNGIICRLVAMLMLRRCLLLMQCCANIKAILVFRSKPWGVRLVYIFYIYAHQSNRRAVWALPRIWCAFHAWIGGSETLCFPTHTRTHFEWLTCDRCLKLWARPSHQIAEENLSGVDWRRRRLYRFTHRPSYTNLYYADERVLIDGGDH